MFPFVVELGEILILFRTDFSNQSLHKPVILVLDFFLLLPSMGLPGLQLDGEQILCWLFLELIDAFVDFIKSLHQANVLVLDALIFHQTECPSPRFFGLVGQKPTPIDADALLYAGVSHSRMLIFIVHDNNIKMIISFGSSCG